MQLLATLNVAVKYCLTVTLIVHKLYIVLIFYYEGQKCVQQKVMAHEDVETNNG